MKDGFFKKEAKAMLWTMLAVPAIGVFAAVIIPQMAKYRCLKYEPEIVQLKGQIKKVVFPGPPNYESIENGDAPEPYWVLYLPAGVCVLGSPKDELNSETEKDVKELQLIIGDYKKYRHLLGKDARVKGRLIHSHTGHHHTKVLLQVEDMYAATN